MAQRPMSLEDVHAALDEAAAGVTADELAEEIRGGLLEIASHARDISAISARLCALLEALVRKATPPDRETQTGRQDLCGWEVGDEDRAGL